MSAADASAAKERTSSCSEDPGAVLSLAAAAHVAENSRQGFTTKKISSHQGWSEVNFKTAIGIGASLRRNGIRSRCQSLNRYAYALNNPTTLIDPLGLDSIGPGALTCGHGLTIPQGQNPKVYCYQHLGIAGGSSPAAFFTSNVDEFGLISPAGFSGGGNGDPGTFSEGFDPNGAMLVNLLSDSGSRFCWVCFAAKDLVVNFPSRTWESLTNKNGCIRGFFTNTYTNANPFTPGAASNAGEASGSAYAAIKVNQALQYAASTPSKTFGTPFLVYPFKSSTFRSLFNASKSGPIVGLLTSADAAGAMALASEYKAASAGACQ